MNQPGIPAPAPPPSPPPSPPPWSAQWPAPESRRASPLARLLWVLTIVLGSGALHQLVSHYAPAAVQGVTAAWVGLYVMALGVLLLEHRLDWLIWLTRYRALLLALMIGAALSVTWAIDPNLATLRVIHLFGATLVATAVGLSLPLPTLLRILGGVGTLLMLASLAAVYAQPLLGTHEYEGSIAWRGVLGDKNSLGFFAALYTGLSLCLFKAADSAARKGLWLLAALLGLFMLIQARSATSLVSLVAGLGFVGALWFARQLGFGLAQQALLALLATGFGISLLQAISTDWLNALLGRSGSLTGRTEVWAQTWSLILDKPFTGYGYGNLWRPTPDSIWIQEQLTDFSWTVFHAHNGLLQVGSELGLVVALLICLFALQQWVESVHVDHRQPSPWGAFAVLYSVAFLLSNYAEARLMVDRDFYWLLWLAMPISALQTQLLDTSPLPASGQPPVPGYRPPPLADNALTLARRTLP